MQTVKVVVGDGRLKIEARATWTGRGMDVLLTGGESPHIGGVTMSVPRKNTTGEGLSCDTWIIPLAGHKDHQVAQPFGELVCRATGQVTVVSAGIHIERAQAWELESIRKNCQQAAQELVTRYRNHLSAEV